MATNYDSNFSFHEQLWYYYTANRGKIRSRYNDLTRKFLAYNDSEENPHAFLRRPQFEALEMYVFVKEFMGNPQVYQMFDDWRNKRGNFSDASYYSLSKSGQITIFDAPTEKITDTLFKQMKKYREAYPNYIYSFAIYDPKYRMIHALHYRDRVVQHCLCDEVLAPILDKKLIYDNSACRIGKGTHFAIGRVSKFLHDFYKKNGANGYFLKCDIRKFFDNIDHLVLKQKLSKVIEDERVLTLLYQIIDRFEVMPGKGLPLGNQTSQWFAIFYLDGFYRLIKEKLRIKYYSRYMDDCVLIYQDKKYLCYCLEQMKQCAKELKIDFNEKTEIFPLKNGVDYLGWHIYLTESGKVICKVKQQTKYKYKRKLKYFQRAYADGNIELEEINQVLSSYRAHLAYGHTYKLQKKILGDFVLRRKNGD